MQELTSDFRLDFLVHKEQKGGDGVGHYLLQRERDPAKKGSLPSPSPGGGYETMFTVLSI